MTIGLDFDGPIFDIGPIIAKEATNLLGRDISVNDITKHGLTECFNISEEQVNIIVQACYKDKWFEEDFFISGALDGLNAIKDLEQPIIIITARPHPKRVKEYLLNYIDIDPTELMVYYTRSKGKGPLAKYLGITVFIDDHFVSLDSVAKYDIKPIIYDTPWNQFESPYHRVKTWDEICVIIKEVADK